MHKILNRLALGAAAAGLTVTVPTLLQDGVQVLDWLALIGYFGALAWRNAPDDDQDGLPDPLEALLRPRPPATTAATC